MLKKKNIFFSVLLCCFSWFSFSFAEITENQEALYPIILNLRHGKSWNQEYEMIAAFSVSEKKVTSTILHFKIHFQVEGESDEGIIILAVPYEFCAEIKLDDHFLVTTLKYAKTIDSDFARCIFSWDGSLIDVQNMDGFIHKFKQILSNCLLEKNEMDAHFTDIDSFVHFYAQEMIKVMSAFAHNCPLYAVTKGDEWTSIVQNPSINTSILKSNFKIEVNSKCVARKNGLVMILNGDIDSFLEDKNKENKNTLNQSFYSLLFIDEKTGWLKWGELFYQGSIDEMSREICLRTRKL